MIGVVDVGGGLRGIYGAGVFDRCLDENISFDCCIGVSAGSANAISFICRQHTRNYRFYHDYSFHREYMSALNFIKTGSYIGLDYVYGTLSNKDGHDPLDYEAFKAYKGIFNAVATDCQTAEPKYFTAEDISENNYRVLNASSCIPIVCRPVEINGRKYCDGGVSDPVPVERAFSSGCDRVVVILTKPVDFIRDGKTDGMGAALLRRSPRIAAALKNRAALYNAEVALAAKYAKEGKCLIVAPDDCCGVSTLSKNKSNLDALYRKGYSDAEKIKDFIK